MTRILIVPGLGGSGPEHWQTKWEALDGRCVRVEQRNWDLPDLGSWCAALEQAVQAHSAPAVLVAHSLGCGLVVHWAQRAPRERVLGALLVAPADVEDEARTPPEVRGFAPLPTAKLPFPSLLVASRDDPFVSYERAAHFARTWEARCVDVGELGHINADSGLGTWPVGRALLRELLASAPFELDERLAADTVVLGESPLSLLLLMNECRYPWLILVPKRAGITELHELTAPERVTLMEESCLLQRVLADDFQADKVNVGALGNVVRQLHVHHVARFLGDPAWPSPVWGHSPRQPYAPEEFGALRQRLKNGPLRACFHMR